ncbi:Flp family type IVb pilin [Variovorax guangxiensis]|uniref:Flp family type IVb pilin n=1 Tax=Variovorax guangxiensis TaxID=1775474 RepID=A0A433MN72_9BURK|nr:Flp family type IVb pilin [Variovorax guangxiensis]RUR69436.1 Flp family type IVb pilin [Variovorax guangxiensis]
MLSSIARFLRDEEGATAIEYGIIAGLISVAIVAVLAGEDGLGKRLAKVFQDITDKLTSTKSGTT